MNRLASEVEASFNNFAAMSKQQFDSSHTALDVESQKFLKSYRRLTSLQAWRSELLDSRMSEGALAFLIEAHNDGVLSHVQARFGCWRPALQALRSMIENVYQSLYYMDHPIELIQWESGDHRMTRSQLEDYVEKHPAIHECELKDLALQCLSKQYTILNKAVHASANDFRMTANSRNLKLSNPDAILLNKWLSNEGEIVRGVNLLFLNLFRSDLLGTKQTNLRQVISLELSAAIKTKVRTQLSISLPSS